MQRLRQAKQTESHRVDNKESEDDDAEWYKQEVGVDPDPGKPSCSPCKSSSITVQICS